MIFLKNGFGICHLVMKNVHMYGIYALAYVKINKALFMWMSMFFEYLLNADSFKIPFSCCANECFVRGIS